MDSSKTSPTPIIILAAATSLLAAATLLRNRRQQKADANKKSTNKSSSLSYPPTPPKSHWLLGNALALQPPEDEPTISHDLIFLQWQQKLESKVVMYNIPLLGRMIVVGDAKVAHTILSSKSGFPKSPTYSMMAPLIGKKSLVATEGTEWATQRKLYSAGFSPDFLRGVVSVIVEKCNRFIAKCDMNIEDDECTDMLAKCVDLTSDVIAAVAFGEDWGGQPDDYSSNKDLQTLHTIRDLTATIGETMVNPLIRYMSISYKWRTFRLSRALDRDMQSLVKRRLDKFRASPESMNQKDILTLTLSSVLRSKESFNPTVENVKLTSDDMESMTSQLKTFYFAGHDTTATTIAWAYWLLVQNPEVLQKAREEIESSLGNTWVEKAMPGKELPTTTYDNLQKCTYLDAVARETLRLYPPASTTRFAVDANATAGGFLLGNSLVHLNVYAIQRDPEVWEEPDRFIPERFVGEAGKKRIASSSFLPFSKGMRDCIGKYFALLETKIALAALICRYDGEVVDTDEVYARRLTSIPKGGCKVYLSHRK